MLIRTIKAIVFIISLIVVSPLAIAAWLEKVASRSEFFHTLSAQFLALIPGLPGCFLRAAYYFVCLDRCSWETHIGFGSIVAHRGARIGRRVSTGVYCVLGHVDIGDGVRMASGISIPSGRRQHLDDDGNLSHLTTYDHVSVGSDCWIGERAVIMADIGSRSIVSSGAVVVKPMPADAVIAGNPAKVLKSLNKKPDSELA